MAAQPQQHSDTSVKTEENPTQNVHATALIYASSGLTSSPVIWTPRFIVIFTLTLVIGLSISSPLTQGWLNGYYSSGSVLLEYTALIVSCLVFITIRARSAWIRLGSIFGIIWATINGIGFALSLISIDTPPPSIAQHLHAATNCALLATYICFSIAHMPANRGDTWFFRVVPALGGLAVVAFYILAPPGFRSLDYFESSVALVSLYLCVLIWWIRPACWQIQPGPALIFGLIPVVLLVFTLPDAVDDQARFFFTQIILLCFLLGSMRMLQGELQSWRTPHHSI